MTKAVAAKGPSVVAKGAAYRMRDLCAQTGLERQTIHFYIQEGLLPEGQKTGRNSALYDEEHLERLRLIRKLQDERFLPLRAIRAVLGGKDGGFSREQRALLRDVRSHLTTAETGQRLVSGNPSFVAAASLCARTQTSPADLEALSELGFISQDEGRRGVLSEDQWLVELWGQLRQAGLSEERGFGVRDLLMIDEAISELFRRERALFLDRLTGLEAREIALVLGRVLPLMGKLLAGLHEKKARDTLSLAAGNGKRKRSNKRSAA